MSLLQVPEPILNILLLQLSMLSSSCVVCSYDCILQSVRREDDLFLVAVLDMFFKAPCLSFSLACAAYFVCGTSLEGLASIDSQTCTTTSSCRKVVARLTLLTLTLRTCIVLL
mmetsp:Transcript_29898/g.46635  ORF Transcript_29898/g.46635 Transcript_29898/m.46635 type:complete len:113 (+) Transcript_29898:688-1026(+)